MTRARQNIQPLEGSERDYDPLLERAALARFVLLGEASHGTHEFYAERARITRRLIEERGFDAVAVEADWPDAYRAGRYARASGDDATAEEALRGFERFPSWMWRNEVVRDFLEWLRAHNDALPPGARKVGFYGLDLYSLYGSIAAVLEVLDEADPAAAARARDRYGCFEQLAPDAEGYASAAAFGAGETCERQAVEQLLELQRLAAEQLGDGEEELFFAEQNARLVKNAERYYRTMFRGQVESWNLRDTHMAETLDALDAHLSRDRPARIVVWEHNSHVGDARATELGAIGELNVGQLVRERHGSDAFLVGFTTYSGTVTAASNWGDRGERKTVRPALPESYEALLHELDEPAFFLPLAEAGELRPPRLERAIGVVYRPQTERQSHYFHARLPDQFDAVIHLDETRAVEPLERGEGRQGGEPPETFPAGV